MTEARTLYELLPELYRRRDAGAGHALHALCTALGGAAATVERDTAALYDSWFVETCEPWALPYIARLVGLEGLPEGAIDPRLLVADAIALARRKGTIPALEHRLSALSGWPVEIAFSAPKRDAVARYWPDPISPLRRVRPFALGGGRFRFHPLGIDCPLFAAPRPRRGIETPFAETEDAPRPLDRSRGALGALSILVADDQDRLEAIAPADIALADLTDWAVPSGDGPHALVDPVLGRFVLGGGSKEKRVAVSFAYSSAGRIGGGPYPCRDAEPAEGSWVAYVHGEALPDEGPKGALHVFTSVADALAAYGRNGGDGLIRILDSGTYELGPLELDADAMPCAPDPNRPRGLAVEALSGETPVLRGSLKIAGGASGIDLSLSGLWVDGTIELSGPVSARIAHCTVQPLSALGARAGGRDAPAAIRCAGAGAGTATLELHACLAGPLDLAAGVAATITDSVVDGYGEAAISGRCEAVLRRMTVLGDSEFDSVRATDTLFDGAVDLANLSSSKLVHCALLEGEGGAAETGCVTGPGKWAFRATNFGSPGYARLKQGASEALLAAASNGSEIGAFNRERALLRQRLMADALAEALPFGIGYAIEAQ